MGKPIKSSFYFPIYWREGVPINKQNNQSGLSQAIGMIIAGYPVYKAFFAVIIAKLTGHDQLVAELEENYQSLVVNFLEIKANEARSRKLSAEERRLMKKLDHYCRKVQKIVKRHMPRETWADFGIDDEK